MYTVVPNSRFERDYKKLPREIQNQVDKSIDLLAQNPHHPSLRVHKRQGEVDIWQARVTRNYRIFFRLEGEVIRLTSVDAHEK